MSRGNSRGNSNLVSLTQLIGEVSVSDKGLGYLLLPINDVISKEQVRKKFTGIEELAETIKNGQLQSPIHVAPKNSDGKYVILRGERRWRACKMAGLNEIKVVIDDTNYDEQTMLIGEIIENVQRVDLTAMELATGIYNLVNNLGVRPVDVAKHLGKGRDFVSRHLAIYTDLPGSVKALADEGYEMSADTMYTLIQLAKVDKEAVDRLCSAASEEERPITRSEAREALKVATTPPAVALSGEAEPVEAAGEASSADTAELDAPTALTPEDHTEDESCAGTTNVHDLPRDELAEQDTTGTDKIKPKPHKSQVAINLMVSVLVDDTYQMGTIAWSYKAPRDGYVFIELENGDTKSFAISDLKLLDVRNVESEN